MVTKKRKTHTRRISKNLRESFGFPSARKYKLPKNNKGTGKLGAMIGGQGFNNKGSSYITVLTQADLIASSEVSYYSKRVADISRRWLGKDRTNRVSVDLVTLFAVMNLEDYVGIDGISIGPRYEQFDMSDDIPDVGEEWEFRNVYDSSPVANVDKARKSTRKLFKLASEKMGWQDNDLDFLGTFIMAVRVRKWTLA